MIRVKKKKINFSLKNESTIFTYYNSQFQEMKATEKLEIVQVLSCGSWVVGHGGHGGIIQYYYLP